MKNVLTILNIIPLKYLKIFYNQTFNQIRLSTLDPSQRENLERERLRSYVKDFNTTGILDLSGDLITDLSLIGSRITLKELNLSRTKIESLEKLKRQPNCSALDLSFSKFSNLVGFKAISSISSIKVVGTPFSKEKLYILQLVVAFGPSLRKIDGKQIPSSYYKKAYGYPPYTPELINRGWKLIYPCPDEDKLNEICYQYGINISQQSKFSARSIPKNSPSTLNLLIRSDYQELKERILQQHNKMILHYEKMLGISQETETPFTDAIENLLQQNGLTLSSDDRVNEILNYVAKFVKNKYGKKDDSRPQSVSWSVQHSKDVTEMGESEIYSSSCSPEIQNLSEEGFIEQPLTPSESDGNTLPFSVVDVSPRPNSQEFVHSEVVDTSTRPGVFSEISGIQETTDRPINVSQRNSLSDLEEFIQYTEEESCSSMPNGKEESSFEIEIEAMSVSGTKDKEEEENKYEGTS